jgi:uncharacterized protein
MNIGSILLIVAGLAFFEIVSSLDNAVVNADVLVTMAPRWRRWFLTYGIAIAVFAVRGFLPWLVVYASIPGIGFFDAFSATFSASSQAKETIELYAPILLAGGGLFLLLLFAHWFFLEEKNYAFRLEHHVHKRFHFWFYAIASVILLVVVWLTIGVSPLTALGAVVGSSAFFIVSGFKRNAEEAEKQLESGHMSDISKILYLELIDATFSIDGVLGAFAFTISIPLIFLGNGLGACVVRFFTARGTAIIKRYAYLKNGAMYSMGFLGVLMLSESLGYKVSSWVAPTLTFTIVFLFFLISRKRSPAAIEKIVEEIVPLSK